MDQQQLYFEMFKEYRSEIKHQESQRSAVSTICVGIAGALIGLTYQDKLLPAKPYLGLLLINFSLIAILMLRKLYERFALGRKRAQLYLKKVDAHTPGRFAAGRRYRKEVGPLEEVWLKGGADNERDYEFITFVRLHHLWEALLIGSVFVGFAFAIVSGGKDQYYLAMLGVKDLAGGWMAGIKLWSIAVIGPLIQLVILWIYQRWQETYERAVRKPSQRPGRVFEFCWLLSQVFWCKWHGRGRKRKDCPGVAVEHGRDALRPVS